MQRFNGSTVQRFNGSIFSLSYCVKLKFVNFCLFALNCSNFKQSTGYLIIFGFLLLIVYFLFGLRSVKWIFNKNLILCCDWLFFERVKQLFYKFLIFCCDWLKFELALRFCIFASGFLLFFVKILLNYKLYIFYTKIPWNTT